MIIQGEESGRKVGENIPLGVSIYRLRFSEYPRDYCSPALHRTNDLQPVLVRSALATKPQWALGNGDQNNPKDNLESTKKVQSLHKMRLERV